MEDEKLIYLVQQYEFLYDLAHPKYMDNTRKDAAWKEISEHMKQPASACKTRWQGLRDSYRRVLNKRKCRGPTTTKIKKWKYEEEMAFLEQYFIERRAYVANGVNSDEEVSDNDLTRNVETLMDVPDIKVEPHEAQPQIGDIFSTTTSPPTTTIDKCSPSCGVNAQCINGTCTCLPGTFGYPYIVCRQKCSRDQECRQDRACEMNTCVNPCILKCGRNTICTAMNHIAVCTCRAGFTGNPLVLCTATQQFMESLELSCSLSSCGPYSVCTFNMDTDNNCSCMEGFKGSPPECRPECENSLECPLNRVCIERGNHHKIPSFAAREYYSKICLDPCKYYKCGTSADCEVVNEKPICSCKPGFTGDPDIGCYDIGATPIYCNTTSCGPDPQCSISSDCASHQLCDKKRCVNLCPDFCGENTECIADSNTVACSCKKNFTGNPLTKCVLQDKDYLQSHIVITQNFWVVLWNTGFALPFIVVFVVMIIFCILKKKKIKKQSINTNVTIANLGPLPLPPISRRGSLSYSFSADSDLVEIDNSSDEIYEEIDDYEFNRVISPEELQNVIRNLRENKNKEEQESTYCPMHPPFSALK